MSDDPFVAVMISCAERAAIRQRTIASLAASDWEAEPIVVVDPATSGRPQERQHRNAREALRRGLETGRPWILFLEDDLEFNRQLRHNLLRWEPLPYLTLASLYNPKIHGRRALCGAHFIEVDPNAIYGSQAYLVSHDCAAHVVEHWDEVEGMQDIKMSRLAGALGMPLYYYAPSLVQHVGKRSTFGGFFHEAGDYDAHFVFPDRCDTGVAGETRAIGEIFGPGFWEMHAPWRDEYDAMGDALVRELDFASALDVGCGNGFLIARLQAQGKTVAGIDGSAAARELAPAEVRDHIAIADLSAPIRPRPADLVICTEVADTIAPPFAEVLVASLCANARSWIFFSAATPGQGGVYHVNEQPPEHWIAKFAARGFAVDASRTARLRAELAPAMPTTWWFAKNALVLGRTGSAARRSPLPERRRLDA